MCWRFFKQLNQSNLKRKFLSLVTYIPCQWSKSGFTLHNHVTKSGVLNNAERQCTVDDGCNNSSSNGNLFRISDVEFAKRLEKVGDRCHSQLFLLLQELFVLLITTIKTNIKKHELIE